VSGPGKSEVDEDTDDITHLDSRAKISEDPNLPRDSTPSPSYSSPHRSPEQSASTEPQSPIMANFPCNPTLLPAGLHVDHGWQRPARARVALGGEPPRRHEQYAILSLQPEPTQAQVHHLLEEVSEFLQQEYPVRVIYWKKLKKGEEGPRRAW